MSYGVSIGKGSVSSGCSSVSKGSVSSIGSTTIRARKSEAVDWTKEFIQKQNVMREIQILKEALLEKERNLQNELLENKVKMKKIEEIERSFDL